MKYLLKTITVLFILSSCQNSFLPKSTKNSTSLKNELQLSITLPNRYQYSQTKLSRYVDPLSEKVTATYKVEGYPIVTSSANFIEDPDNPSQKKATLQLKNIPITDQLGTLSITTYDGKDNILGSKSQQTSFTGGRKKIAVSLSLDGNPLIENGGEALIPIGGEALLSNRNFRNKIHKTTPITEAGNYRINLIFPTTAIELSPGETGDKATDQSIQREEYQAISRIITFEGLDLTPEYTNKWEATTQEKSLDGHNYYKDFSIYIPKTKGLYIDISTPNQHEGTLIRIYRVESPDITIN